MKYLLLLTLVAFASAAPEAEANAVAEADPKAEAAPVAEAEADPEADPWLHYGYGHGLAYYGLGGYYHPYSYGYWGRKKREAEAAPVAEAAADPEADPWLHYGYG